MNFGNNQDVLNYLGGVFSNPLIVGQSPSANTGEGLPNIFTQPMGGSNPFNNQQVQTLSNLMQSVPNSDVNHSNSSGGWQTSFGQTNPDANNSIMQALGAQNNTRSMGSQYAL